MKKDIKNRLIPMTDYAWEMTKLIAEKNERSASGQVRHWINEGIRMYHIQEQIDEIAKEASREDDAA